MLLASTQRHRGGIEWLIDRDGKLQFSLRGKDGKKMHRFGTDKPVIPTAQLGKWNHLATVFDLESRQVRHFLNGSQVASQRIEADAFGTWLRARELRRKLRRSFAPREPGLPIFRFQSL